MRKDNMTKVSVKMIVCILEIPVIELVSTQWSKGKRKSEAIDITYLTNYFEITFSIISTSNLLLLCYYFEMNFTGSNFIYVDKFLIEEYRINLTICY